MMSTKRSRRRRVGHQRQPQGVDRRAYGGDRRAQLVRHVGDEVLAQRLQPPRLADVDEHGEQPLVLAVDHRQRRGVDQQAPRPRSGGLDLARRRAARRARAFQDRRSSAFRISSSAARPSTSEGMPSVARSAGLTSRMQPLAGRAPARPPASIPGSGPADRARRAAWPAWWPGCAAMVSNARPSSATSSVPVGRRRTARSPAAIRRAASVIRRSARDSSCATVVEATRATTSATASARPQDVAHGADGGLDLVERHREPGRAPAAAGQGHGHGGVHQALRGPSR